MAERDACAAEAQGRTAMRRVMLLMLALAGCVAPDPVGPEREPACRNVNGAVSDDGTLAQLHAFQSEHPGASCNTVVVVFGPDGMRATYECTWKSCTL